MKLYERYTSLQFSRTEHGVLEIAMGSPGKLAIADERMHQELAEVWLSVNEDEQTRAVLVRGVGKGFSGGGSLEMVHSLTQSQEARMKVWREARQLVHNMINCEKPIVAAVHGAAAGVGLAVALLADICIVASNAKLIDGHVKLGVTAGDHAAIIWPLLCGMAKAKYYLLLGDEVSGEEAERIGLVAKCVAESEVLECSRGIADRLACGAQNAVRMTKHSLNHWLRAAEPILEASLGMEFMNFQDRDAAEGLAALRERRSPNFRLKEPEA
jgi:enoyl-CoA hydratase